MAFLLATTVAFGWLLVLAGVRQGHWVMGVGLVLARLTGAIGTRYFIEVGLLLLVAVGFDRILNSALQNSGFARGLPRWLPLAGGCAGAAIGLMLAGNQTGMLYGGFLGALLAGWVRGAGELRHLSPLFWISEFIRVLSLFVSAVWLIFRLS
ncbi:MAG: hypothetical protein M0Z66_11275 [Thermaerobacter sp.]|nr:hypothetical protein [Thermaerobacter sp.]